MGFTIQDYDLKSTFAINKKLLLFAGFYPRRSTKYRYFYFFRSIVNVFFSLAQFLSMTIQLFIDRNDVSKLSESLQYFITLVGLVWILLYFAIYKETLLEIEDALTSPTFYGHSNYQLKLLRNKIIVGQTAGKTFRFLAATAVVFWGLPPLLDSNETKKLPMPGWFPYNVNEYYYPTSAFQILGIANTAYTATAIDSLFWVLICIASGQFEILKENLRRINYEDKETTEERLKFCVKHHLEIVNLVCKTNVIYSTCMLMQFFASIIIICFTGFLMMILPLSSMQFIDTFTYFVCIMCEVAIYCWYGHDIMATSSTIGDALYRSNWYESDLPIRKIIIIFMEKTKKPIILSAGGFVNYTLGTVTTILKSSYSYFAVLLHLYNDA